MKAETIVLSCVLASSFLFLTVFNKEGKVEVCRIVFDPPGLEPDDEVIEICNYGGRAIDLNGWRLSDGEGEYTLPSDTMLKAGESLTLTGREFNPTRKTRGVFLSNKSDCVRLFNNDNEIIDDWCWKNSPEVRRH